MKPLHDLLTTNGKTKVRAHPGSGSPLTAPQFAIGETGLGFAGSIEDRVNWMKQITSQETKNALPNLVVRLYARLRVSALKLCIVGFLVQLLQCAPSMVSLVLWLTLCRAEDYDFQLLSPGQQANNKVFLNFVAQ